MSQEQGRAVSHGPRVIAGRYAILNELGRGGMGVVWLAEDTMIGRHVAIKELHLPDGVPHSERQTFEQRVLREARTAGRLNDPAVVTVFDVVQESGATYIVMELIQAPTLSDVVKERGPLPADQVAKIAEQLLSALEAAHHAGIVHRDVKPSNIMLAANGRVKLTDFGIAQSLDDPRLTSSGILIGSPSYMAPERIQGEEAASGADLWALGAVLFFAIEGYSPFERPTTAATMHSILTEVPYLTRAHGALASVITGLMITTPQARLNSAQARGLLTHVQAPTGPTTGPTAYYPPQPTQLAAPAQRRGINKALAWTLTAVLLVVGGVLGYLLSSVINAPAAEERAEQSLTYGDSGDIADFKIADGYCSAGALAAKSSYGSGTDCDKAFRFQVYGVRDMASVSDELSYVSDGVKNYANSYCAWLFQTERVSSENRANLVFSVVVPSAKTWAAEPGEGGERTVFCVLSAKDGSMLTKSQVAEKN